MSSSRRQKGTRFHGGRVVLIDDDGTCFSARPPQSAIASGCTVSYDSHFSQFVWTLSIVALLLPHFWSALSYCSWLFVTAARYVFVSLSWSSSRPTTTALINILAESYSSGVCRISRCWPIQNFEEQWLTDSSPSLPFLITDLHLYWSWHEGIAIRLTSILWLLSVIRHVNFTLSFMDGVASCPWTF